MFGFGSGSTCWYIDMGFSSIPNVISASSMIPGFFTDFWDLTDLVLVARRCSSVPPSSTGFFFPKQPPIVVV
eukprot:m.200138 g.200138  ORF g.200138 m.200138 type:complete len:72 (+) comp32762_c0_seq1:1015-1230(+)